MGGGWLFGTREYITTHKKNLIKKKVTWNKTNHVLVENELNELPGKGKAIWTKGLIKDLINKYSILNGPKYFCSGTLQNYFVFIPVKKCIKYFSGTTRIYLWKSNGMSEVLKI